MFVTQSVKLEGIFSPHKMIHVFINLYVHGNSVSSKKNLVFPSLMVILEIIFCHEIFYDSSRGKRHFRAVIKSMQVTCNLKFQFNAQFLNVTKHFNKNTF